MPNVRLDNAPSTKATMVVMINAATTATHGLRPSVSPLLFDSGTQLPITKPATPYASSWASDTIPPYADRKMIVEATKPRMSARVTTNSTKNCEPNVGRRTRSARTTSSAMYPPPGTAGQAHSARPNKPCGRTASTTASSANVRMIA